MQCGSQHRFAYAGKPVFCMAEAFSRVSGDARVLPGDCRIYVLLRFSFLPLFLRFSDKFRDIFRKKQKSYANFLHTVSKSAIMKDIKKLIFIGVRPPPLRKSRVQGRAWDRLKRYLFRLPGRAGDYCYRYPFRLPGRAGDFCYRYPFRLPGHTGDYCCERGHHRERNNQEESRRFSERLEQRKLIPFYGRPAEKPS